MKVSITELSILTNPLYKATKISLSGLPVKAVGDVLVSLQHQSVSATDGGWDNLLLTEKKGLKTSSCESNVSSYSCSSIVIIKNLSSFENLSDQKNLSTFKV